MQEQNSWEEVLSSLMFQLKKRSDTKRGWRFVTTICFYQDSRHDESIFWIQKTLGLGFVNRRNDGMTELRITGFNTVNNVLLALLPFIKFKINQANALLEALEIMTLVNHASLNNEQLKYLVERVLIVQANNYSSKSKKNELDIMDILGLTP